MSLPAFQPVKNEMRASFFGHNVVSHDSTTAGLDNILNFPIGIGS